ncbi:hypothetical protein HaLaN_27359, partial [Haematococcus lacustris]
MVLSTTLEWAGPTTGLGCLDLLVATEQLMQCLEVKIIALAALSDRSTGPFGQQEEALDKWLRGPLRLLVLSIQLLQDTAVLGPAGLAARPAAWLPTGQQLIKDWCDRLVTGACQLAQIMEFAEAEQALALLIITLGIAVPLLTMLGPT